MLAKHLFGNASAFVRPLFGSRFSARSGTERFNVTGGTVRVLTMLGALLISVASIGSAPGQSIEWQTDVAAAQELARESGRPVWLHFKTSWCRPCRELDLFVFRDLQVIRSVNATVIPVLVDADKEVELTKQYAVESVPFDVVLLPNGRVVVRRKSPSNKLGYETMMADMGKLVDSYRTEDKVVLNQHLDEIDHLMKAEDNAFASARDKMTPDKPEYMQPRPSVNSANLKRFSLSRRDDHSTAKVGDDSAALEGAGEVYSNPFFAKPQADAASSSQPAIETKSNPVQVAAAPPETRVNPFFTADNRQPKSDSTRSAAAANQNLSDFEVPPIDKSLATESPWSIAGKQADEATGNPAGSAPSESPEQISSPVQASSTDSTQSNAIVTSAPVLREQEEYEFPPIQWTSSSPESKPAMLVSSRQDADRSMEPSLKQRSSPATTIGSTMESATGPIETVEGRLVAQTPSKTQLATSSESTPEPPSALTTDGAKSDRPAAIVAASESVTSGAGSVEEKSGKTEPAEPTEPVAVVRLVQDSQPEATANESIARIIRSNHESEAPQQKRFDAQQVVATQPQARQAPKSEPAPGMLQQMVAPAETKPVDERRIVPTLQSKYALKGKCPVTLVEQGQWVDGDREVGCVHRGRVYLFATTAKRDQFLNSPDTFSPLLAGFDPVIFNQTGQLVEGHEEYGIFMGKGGQRRIVLFVSSDNQQQFKSEPAKYLNAVREAMVSSISANVR